MSKSGTIAFTYPLGRNGHYKPFSISAPAINTTFKAMYANLDPSEIHSFSSKDSLINDISTNEYWSFERTVGTANVSVSLYRDNMGCSYDSISNLKITAYNGSTWKDLGQGSTSGNDTLGTITTNGVATVYGIYTLATTDTFDCVPCRADAGEDKTMLKYNSVRIGALQTASYDTLLWIPSTSLLTSNKEITRCTSLADQAYLLLTKTTSGCIATDAVLVRVIFRELELTPKSCLISN
jgi:hypothetical protein